MQQGNYFVENIKQHIQKCFVSILQSTVNFFLKQQKKVDNLQINTQFEKRVSIFNYVGATKVVIV